MGYGQTAGVFFLMFITALIIFLGSSNVPEWGEQEISDIAFIVVLMFGCFVISLGGLIYTTLKRESSDFKKVINKKEVDTMGDIHYSIGCKKCGRYVKIDAYSGIINAHKQIKLPYLPKIDDICVCKKEEIK